jgi:hypothetical protein
VLCAQLTIYPAIWTNSTQSIVKNALARQGEAAKLRMAIDNVCQETVLQERSVSAPDFPPTNSMNDVRKCG